VKLPFTSICCRNLKETWEKVSGESPNGWSDQLHTSGVVTAEHGQQWDDEWTRKKRFTWGRNSPGATPSALGLSRAQLQPHGKQAS